MYCELFGEFPTTLNSRRSVRAFDFIDLATVLDELQEAAASAGYRKKNPVEYSSSSSLWTYNECWHCSNGVLLSDILRFVDISLAERCSTVLLAH